ncbi:MAG: hypothetical protein KC547_03455 [Anaerolineae bacterium]|nr:hypothetical protein [Anaerolineae bacterium]MCA9907689.1 hypothetical protein [Anaerolineae bacterium]
MSDEAFSSVVEGQPEDLVSMAAAPSRHGLLQRLRALLFGGATDDAGLMAERLIALSSVIEQYPDEAGNYVMRGELYLEMNDRGRATEDFECALELAEAQLERSDWGIVTQSVRDRALVGLEKARAER